MSLSGVCYTTSVKIVYSHIKPDTFTYFGNILEQDIQWILMFREIKRRPRNNDCSALRQHRLTQRHLRVANRIQVQVRARACLSLVQVLPVLGALEISTLCGRRGTLG